MVLHLQQGEAEVRLSDSVSQGRKNYDQKPAFVHERTRI